MSCLSLAARAWRSDAFLTPPSPVSRRREFSSCCAGLVELVGGGGLAFTRGEEVAVAEILRDRVELQGRGVRGVGLAEGVGVLGVEILDLLVERFLALARSSSLLSSGRWRHPAGRGAVVELFLLGGEVLGFSGRVLRVTCFAASAAGFAAQGAG